MASTPSNVTTLAGKGGTSVPPAGTRGKTVTKHNEEVLAACASAIEKIKAKEAERKRINDEISAIREGVKARGINMHSFRVALAYSKMDTVQRDGFDDSLVIVREAIGLPIQPALFTEAEAPVPQPDAPNGGAGDKQH